MQRYYRIFTVFILCTSVSILLHVHQAKAQWVEQSFTLKPGWNSIYIEVQPEPRKCNEVFKDIPIASVWTWNPELSSVRRIQDPHTLVPHQPEWLVFFPPSSSESILTNLYILLGGKAYLIKLAGDQTVNWTILGRPCLPRIKWKSNSFNFVGFHLNPGHEPTFRSFFAGNFIGRSQPGVNPVFEERRSCGPEESS